MRLPVILALFLSLATPAWADMALIAVATNFRPVAEELVAAFAADTGDRVDLTSGATAKLAAQIEAGAPFDAFLSADSETPERLAATGLANGATRFTYAIGHLVLWSADPDRDLSDPAVALRSARTVAIANPALAPYGRAATQTLDAMQLSEIGSKLVMGENIGQAQALVASGAADLGFVSASGVPFGAGAAWPVPQKYHQPIRQDAVLLAHGSDNAAAQAFLSYIRSDAARAVILRHGYGVGP